MTRSSQRRRLFAAALLLGAAFAGLGWRLVDVQVLRHAEFRAKADRKQHRAEALPARRGEIRDVRGEPLARSRPVVDLVADPTLIGDRRAELIRLLAPRLRLPTAELDALLAPQFLRRPGGELVPDESVTLVRNFPLDDWTALEAVLATNHFGFPEKLARRADREQLLLFRRSIRVDGVGRYLRDYPNGATAAAVIGYLDAAGAGAAGIEQLVHRRMRGTDGWREYVVDHRGRRIPAAGGQELPPLAGDNVYLTLDTGLQLITERELARAAAEHRSLRACGVMLQPATGRILAMASWPPFDPAARMAGTNEIPERWNLATAWAYEPGSTFKIVAATAALNERLASPGETIFCENGHWRNGPVSLSDDQGHAYGALTLQQVIAKSSNIGTYKLALRLGPARLDAYLRAFGFGQRTGVNYPDESAGVLSPSPWGPVEFSRIPIGYTIAVTPMQLALATAALGNDGRLMRPILIDRIENAQGRLLAQAEPQVVREICRPEVAAQMRRALRDVVEDGTAAKARLERYSVAGKTGTAQKIPYRTNGHYASFAGFLPAERPELCILVIFDQPPGAPTYYGGVVAAPAFRAIAEQAVAYLGLPPDLPVPEAELAQR
ncbi:MAG: peptidoglycan D,D-transpeptidase FtsI family protein [Limisphaerales bacterium]